MEENDNIEKITLEKQKKPLSEKQRENLKKMRERKRELSMTRVKSESPQKQHQPHHQLQPHHQPQDTQKDINSRISDLERDIYEIKMRKQIKAEIRDKIAKAKIMKSKAVDKETEEEQETNIQEHTHTFNYNSLFY